MLFRCVLPLLFAIVLGVVPSLADEALPPRLTKETREQIVHAFASELVYIRTYFPMGKSGLKLKDGALTPNGDEMQRLMALWGPAAKPGDQARISNIEIKDKFIHFEINGGPVKKAKWYQHIQIQGAGGATPTSPSDSNANARGSFVDLYFDKYVPELTGPELKQLLRPVFDFDSKSPLEAYLESVPPQIRDAIKSHNVLVGMNREMVTYSKGRPTRKVREHGDDGVEYEEWIYGDPPQDVDFVRLVSDEVVRVETMKVNGQKIIRTDKEVDLGETKVAKKKGERPPNAPTLRRPGEEMPETSAEDPSGGSSRVPSRKPDSDSGSSPQLIAGASR